MFARLQAPHPKAALEVVHIYQQEAVMLATLLLPIVRARTATEKALKELLVQHPDHEILASLPGVGALLGPGLLVKFGDDRNRFPTAASVQGLAGTCPVTNRTGNAHLKRQVMGREVVVAITDGRLDDPAEPSGRASGRGLVEALDPWEQIFGASRNGWLVSLDGRRRKRVLVRSIGE